MVCRDTCLVKDMMVFVQHYILIKHLGLRCWIIQWDKVSQAPTSTILSRCMMRFSILINSSVVICDYVKMNDKSVDTCNKCLELEVEFVKKNDVYIELSKWFTNLEQHCISLEVAMQLNQEFFQKDKSCENQNLKAQIQEKVFSNAALKNELRKLKGKNVTDTTILKPNATTIAPGMYKLDLEPLAPKVLKNKDLKAQIQEKVFSNAALKNELRKLKGKNVTDTTILKPNATTIAPGMYKLDLEPLAPKVLKNKDAHIDYIKHSREHADILWEIVKNARALSPLDSNLDSACKYVQRIQEVLVYVKDTCPCISKPSEKLVLEMKGINLIKQ
ncbi:hypothetical protein Tco_0780791 [Tanacetum coccineum]